MSHVFDKDVAAFQPKLHAIIARSQAEVPSQFTAKRFRAADVWPLAKPADKMQHARLDRPGQLRILLQRSGRDENLHPPSVARIDTKVNSTVDRLTQKTDRLGRVTETTYDRLNRLLTEEWFADDQDETADNTIEFTYDLAGRMLTATDAGVHSYSYTYDALDRLTDETQDLAGLDLDAIFWSKYDPAGNRRELQASFDVGTNFGDFTNEYAYDALNRLTVLTQAGGGTHDVAEKRVDFTYDLAGQYDAITRYSDVAGTSAV